MFGTHSIFVTRMKCDDAEQRALEIKNDVRALDNATVQYPKKSLKRVLAKFFSWLYED